MFPQRSPKFIII